MTHIALLRAINVGGRNAIAMPALRALLEDLGFGNVRSLLQTGNLVFESSKRNHGSDDIERTLEAATAKHLNVGTDFLVRTAAEWSALIASNPFPQAAKNDPAHLVAMPLKAAPSTEQVESLRAAITGPELIEVIGKTAYLVYPEGIGRSRLTNTLIEKKLNTRGTARNWNTVLKLAALAAAPAA